MQLQSPFKMLKILHTAILGGMVLFTILSLVVPHEELPVSRNFETIFQAVTAGLSLLTLLIGFNIFKRRLVAVHNNRDTAEKRMDMYRSACITWWAMIDAPGFLSIIGFYLTANYAFLALAIFQTVLLAVFMPRRDNIILILNLTSEEVQRLEGKKS